MYLTDRVLGDGQSVRAAPEADAVDEQDAPSTCEHCGAPARIFVLEGYAQKQRVMRYSCLACADRAFARRALDGVARPGMRLSTLVAIGGLALVGLGLLADYLVPDAHPGFGWQQSLGVCAGALLAFVGLLLRAELIAMSGVFLLVAAVCGDLLGLTRGAGIGWKQSMVLALGAGLAGLGLVRRALRRRARQQRPETGRKLVVRQTVCPR
jgi:hypothetical protein